MGAIKSIYDFVLSIQIIALVLFFGYLIDSGGNKIIPLNIEFSEAYSFSFDFQFSYTTIILFMAAMGVLLVISSIQVVGTGLSDEGVDSIKKFVSFITQFSILNLPILYFTSQDETLVSYSVFITLILLVIHFLNFIENQGGRSE